jgi:2-succinyl-6-hydroxy-2,4-cyclohexadiene-1-carboxylate synthase
MVAVGDGLWLHVARSLSGSGSRAEPPVVLLHGFTGSGETWGPLAATLHGYATIAVDLAGHGRSDAPADPARYALTRFADDLHRLLDTLGVERAALLGYSMGARAALQFALAHPERLSALLLESASPGLASPEERAARVAADAALADAIEREGVESFVDRWERLPLWASQGALPASVRAALRAQRLTNRATGLANSLRGAGAGAVPPLLGRLHALRMPTLLVAGALDEKYVEYARAMAGVLPDATVEIVAGAGHAVHLERPEALAAAVRRFLGTHATID